MKKHDIRLIYTTPLHQYPTTVTLSPRRRQSLIQIAEKNLIPILEDDYDHEFHYVGPPPSPLSAETEMGIYVCSFSKLLFPGARLGIIGCDSDLMDHFTYQKFITSRQTDSLTQIGLSAWIKDGGFERHLRKMRRIYEGRYQFMAEQLRITQSTAEIAWQTPTGGMSFWVNFFKGSQQIAELAKRKGAFFQNESEMDALAKKGTHLRIGFAGVNEKEMEQGFKILRSVL